MTSLFYKILNNFGECRKTAGSGASRVRIHVDGAEEGFISVGGVSAPLRGGVARLDISSLPDGEYAPILHAKEAVIRLESIVKLGSDVTLSPCDRLLIRTLCQRLEAAETKLADLSRLVEAHTEAIYGKPLLDYLA